MLKGLEIENFAIIDNLRLEFNEGLNIFTGETGAGKTIIMEALSMVLGEKAGPGLIRTGEEKARVSALFHIPSEVQSYIKDLCGLKEEEILLEREIVCEGRGNCYLNGKMVPLSSIREIGNMLVDIHGQHEHQSLLNTSRHIDLLDRFGGIYDKQREITKKYNELKRKEKRLEELSALEKNKESLKELLQFQLEEIKNAHLVEGEEAEIEKERSILANAQKLTEIMNAVYQVLYENEGAVVENIKKLSSQLKTVQEIDQEVKKFVRVLEDSYVSLSELATQLRVHRDGIQYDPRRLEELTERQDMIEKLKRKYGSTIKDILNFAENAGAKLKEISSNEEEIKRLTQEIKELREETMKEALVLSEKRRACAKKLEKRMVEELAELEMKKTQFRVEIKPVLKPGTPESIREKDEIELGPKGVDEVEFLISPNPGEELRPLSKIASGGESSRIMLALKAILADVDEIPVMVFDEIDLGIGGKTASSVGEKLESLARKKQILCITHLPQIAAYGNLHFKVEKIIEKGRTRTSVRRLAENERVEEIARMISGEKITPASLKHAGELLKR